MELEKTKPAIDLTEEPEESKKPKKSTKDQTSTIKKFDGWSLDPFAEIKPYTVKTPFYDVVNDLPLPITYDDRGKVKGIFDCFNCGSNEHRCNECPVVLDHSCVHLNKSWMQAYGKAPTARSYRPPRGNVRYFEKLKDLDDENKEGDDEELKASGLKFFDSLEEMPEVPKLATKRAKSISEMEKDEEEFRKRRRGNRRHSGGNYDRRHRDHRNFDSYGGRGGRDSYGGRGRAGYQRRHNNYQDRRYQPYDDRRRNHHYRQQNWRGGRGGHYNNHRRRGRGGRGGSYQNQNGGYQTQNFYHNPNQQQQGYQGNYFHQYYQ